MPFALHSFMTFGNPALQTIIPTIVAAYAFQTAIAIPAIILQEDRYYDLSGSLTYLGCTALSLHMPALRAVSPEGRQGAPIPGFPQLFSHHPRQLIMSGLTALWAIRLGLFLFWRVLKSGGDRRFEKLKKKVPVATRLTDLQPGQFFIFWVAQATWVSLVALPVFAVNAIPRHLQPPMNWKDFLGITVWIAGFLIEVVADHQKAQWRKEKDQKKHDEDWISRGLWSKSRHPNYFGLLPEISSNYRGKYHLDWHFSLITSHSQFIYPTWWGYMMAISPLFTYLLLAKVTGIPPLERPMDKRLRGRKDYEDYKRKTPIFFPKL